MPRGWDWDFEDERPQGRDAPRPQAPGPEQGPPARVAAPGDGGARPGAGAGGPQSAAPAGAGSANGPSRSRLVQVRRRRLAAVLVLAALIAILVAAVTAARHGHSPVVSAHVRPNSPAGPANHTLRDEELGAVRSVLAYTPFVKQGSGQAQEVALTFDDGPGPYTPEVLRVLERYRVPATFFVIGRMLRYFGASTVREIEDGDVIGDHTENHPMLAHLSRHEQHEELFEQIARVELLGGRRPTLFRPPYGSFNATTLRELKALHLLMVLWSADTDDYAQPGVSVIVQRALEGVAPGAILLLHDGGGDRSQTIAALPAIVRGIRSRGYRLVTVPQLLKDDPPPHGQPIPPNLSGD